VRLIFVELRDRQGIVQVVFNPEMTAEPRDEAVKKGRRAMMK
jgi:aspartyl-tRNA synthetase